MNSDNITTIEKASAAFYDEEQNECGRITVYDNSRKALLKLAEEERIDQDNDFEYEFEEIQLLEGRTYYFELTTENGYIFDFDQSPRLLKKIRDADSGKYIGNLVTGINTGLLQFYVRKTDNPDEKAYLTLEVQSIKTGSLRDYRKMLDAIAKKCNDLLLQIQAPSFGRLEINDNEDAETLTQRFYFLRSLLDSTEFKNAVNRILRNPHIRSEGEEVEKQLSRGGFRIGRREALQIAGRYPRINLPSSHPLYNENVLTTLPKTVLTVEHRDNEDIPENRFVKFALQEFASVLEAIKVQIELKNGSKELVLKEISVLQNSLEDILSHSLFKSLSDLTQLPLSSPVLQRKEGYREILQVWLQLELSAKLVWNAGKELFKGGLRDVATLYEYWLFFKLIDSVNKVFDMKDGLEDGKFITETDDGLGLQLEAGKNLQYRGTYPKDLKGKEEPELNVMFCYNRTFKGQKTEDHDYKQEGSWTKYMRPDYTISLWPYGIRDIKDPKDKEKILKNGYEIAEEEEKIVHLHFDAKYRIVNPQKAESIVDIVELFKDHGQVAEDQVFGDEDEEEGLEEEEKATREGIASKRADLLKMHAYRDAIKRTEGAYILYPGSPDQNNKHKWQGFHELLPGIGAFPVCPGSAGDMSHVEQFLMDSADLCVERFSQLYRSRHWKKTIYEHSPDKLVETEIPLIVTESKKENAYFKYKAEEGAAEFGKSGESFIQDEIPPADIPVAIGVLRPEAERLCREAGCFFFHAVRIKKGYDPEPKQPVISPSIFSAKYLIPFELCDKNPGTPYNWYANIKSIEVVSFDKLKDKLKSKSGSGEKIDWEKIFADHPYKVSHYYLMNLEGIHTIKAGLTEWNKLEITAKEKHPEIKPTEGTPLVVRWSDLWKN